MIMSHTNYESSDFRPNSEKKNGRHSAILDLIHLKFSTLDTFSDCLQVSYSLCIQIMVMGHKNYESSDFRSNSAKENGRQSAILDPILSIFFTFNDCLQVSYSLCI